MNWLHALILGIVQGCTEFFPISSSAHLKLMKTWLKLPSGEEAVLFDLACHLGTLLVLVVYFRKDLRDICFSHPKKMTPYLIALAPLPPSYFLLKHVRVWASQPQFLGVCLLVTALMLFIPRKFFKAASGEVSWKDALWIGAFQSVALVPGISRSASTIMTGLYRGLTVQKAVRFSFLLSIPAVAGGAFLELLKVADHHLTVMDALLCGIGFGVSALVGIGVVRFAIPLLEKGSFRSFAWYCLIVSILLTLYL